MTTPFRILGIYHLPTDEYHIRFDIKINGEKKTSKLVGTRKSEFILPKNCDGIVMTVERIELIATLRSLADELEKEK